MVGVEPGDGTGVTADRSRPPIRITDSDGTAILTEPATASLPTVERVLSYDCASEGRRSGRWRGIPLDDLLAWADIRADATHLLVESRDGHAACVAVEEAIRGLLALEALEPGNDGGAGSPAERADGCPRLLSPGIAAGKTVKAVRRIEAFRCTPDEDPRAVARLIPATKE